MAERPLRMAFVMDPIEAEDIDASTTLALMLEAQRRGHELCYIDPADLCVSACESAARAIPVCLSRGRAAHTQRGEPRFLLTDRDVDVVFQRTDPPVDDAFIVASQILDLCRRALVLNRPASVVAYNEKLLALHFRDLMPETTVTRHIADLMSFMEALGGEMIVKPLNGKGGEGIFHLGSGERNLASILEQATAFETRWVMAQRYLPAIREGDKRILLLEGELLGAVLRVPASSEVRANFHAGGRAERAVLSEAEHRIIERLGPRLRRDGLFFVGIDVIGDRLTEVNVTSPMGIQEVNRLEGVRLEERVIARVEERLAAGSVGSSAGC